MIKRTDFVAVLKKVEPALSSKNFIPIHTCFCFGGGKVLAYDDTIALEADCTAEVDGGLKGQILLPFLSASRSDNVEFLPGANESEVIVKAGRPKLTIPLISSTKFLFRWPEIGPNTNIITVKITNNFMECLTKAMVSMEHDPSNPWRMGVTLNFGKKVTMYSTNNKTATRVRLAEALAVPEGQLPIILPPRFCDNLVAIAKSDPPTDMLLNDDWIECKFTSGLRMFCKTVRGANVELYQQAFSDAKQLADAIGVADIPRGFERCLERAQVISQFSTDPGTSFSYSEAEQKINMITQSGAAIADDNIGFTGKIAGTVRVNPADLVSALSMSTGITFGAQFVVLSSEGFTHLVSTIIESAKPSASEGE